MSNILVINTGSTSIKFKLFDLEEKELLAGCLEHVEDYDTALKKLLRQVVNFGEIVAVGHRIVHGGDVFFEPTILNDKIISELEKLNHLAPLHNPYNLAGVRAATSFLPEVPQIAVFDTAFFKDLPDYARTYALPKKIIEQYKIFRFGFHGTSHEYAMIKVADELGVKTNKLNMISCHLGGGASIAAIKNGQAVDISSGYTPNEGLVMMSRTGDLDSGIIFQLLKKIEGVDDDAKSDYLYKILNNESGIKGLTGGIDDFKELIKQVSLGNRDANLAFEVFIYKIIKYIGSYWAVLGGKVDAISFTGAIGAGHPLTRETIMRKLKFLCKINHLTIAPNEELMIAKKIKNWLKNDKKNN